MIEIFYKSLEAAIRTPARSGEKTKFPLSRCCQYESFMRWCLTSTVFSSKCCTTEHHNHNHHHQQQQNQIAAQQKILRKHQQKPNQKQRKPPKSLLYFLQVQLTAILNDSHDHNAEYAKLPIFSNNLRSDGSKRSGSDKTVDAMQQCASYVDAVPAPNVAIVNSFPTPNITQIDESNTVVDGVPPNVADGALGNTGQTIALSTDGMPMLRRFYVELDAELEPHELVGLTGDSKALGEWRLESCIPLQRNGNGWSASVMLPSEAEPTNYRYFIYTEDALGRKQIRRWETHLKPRTFSDRQIVDRFGVIGARNDTENVTDTATDSGTNDLLERAQVNRGWLTFESIVQFKFEREQMFRVHDVQKFDAEQLRIKFEPLEEAEEGVHVDVTHFDYGQSHLRRQQKTGATYKRGDIVIFHLTAIDLKLKEIQVFFYTLDDKLIGRSHIKPQMLNGSEGELELDVMAPTEFPSIVAQLTLPYVIVRPYTNASLLDFHTTYAHYWPKSWPNLDVGHRGNGRSFIANPPAERENTLASFMRAYESHADMIELDVHLTSDGIPIIYHDFGIHTAPQHKSVTKRDQLEYVLIKDVSYETLKGMRIFAIINGTPIEFPAHNAESRIEHRIFPRLREVLDELPKTLGIDVEIKWPQRTACGGVEAQQTIDKNFFVDRVLDTIIYHGCGRPLIFSSFDADICTMLRFKQNLFPVMFLTIGETKKWSPYMDLRTRNFLQAINNAQAFELAGTAPHAEDFLGENGAALMQKAINAGQIAVVWGDDCNSKDRVKYFSAIGATATCYDRADLFVPDHKERAFFNSSNLIAEFEAQCRANDVHI